MASISGVEHANPTPTSAVSTGAWERCPSTPAPSTSYYGYTTTVATVPEARSLSPHSYEPHPGPASPPPCVPRAYISSPMGEGCASPSGSPPFSLRSRDSQHGGSSSPLTSGQAGQGCAHGPVPLSPPAEVIAEPATPPPRPRYRSRTEHRRFSDVVRAAAREMGLPWPAPPPPTAASIFNPQAYRTRLATVYAARGGAPLVPDVAAVVRQVWDTPHTAPYFNRVPSFATLGGIPSLTLGSLPPLEPVVVRHFQAREWQEGPTGVRWHPQGGTRAIASRYNHRAFAVAGQGLAYANTLALIQRRAFRLLSSDPPPSGPLPTELRQARDTAALSLQLAEGVAAAAASVMAITVQQQRLLWLQLVEGPPSPALLNAPVATDGLFGAPVARYMAASTSLQQADSLANYMPLRASPRPRHRPRPVSSPAADGSPRPRDPTASRGGRDAHRGHPYLPYGGSRFGGAPGPSGHS